QGFEIILTIKNPEFLAQDSCNLLFYDLKEIMLSQCCNTNHQENRRTNFMNQADRESVRQLISQKYCRCIGQHHAQSGTEHHPEYAIETCRQCNCGNLGFVTNFCQKE